MAVCPLPILFNRLGTPHVVSSPGFVQMTHPKLPGQPIEVPEQSVPGHQRSGWVRRMARVTAGGVDGPNLQRRAKRRCVFCEHVWHTAVAEENRA